MAIFHKFFRLMKDGDKLSMIMRSRPKSKWNAISRLEDIPQSQRELEKHYVYDVNIIEDRTRVKFRMIIATSITFE